MSRFKVGDRVRAIGSHYSGHTMESHYNLPRSTGVVVGVGDGYIWVDYDGTSSPPVNPDCFALVQEGPVRTVTRREIVPGVYGRVKVHANAYALNIHTQKDGECWSAADLRAAAAVFIELADALEANAA